MTNAIIDSYSRVRRRWRATAGFNRAARFYESVSDFYSTGQIAATKAAQMPYMQPGRRVLYLGVGAGEDALLAARRGVRLTCIDLAPRMIKRVRRRLVAEGLTAELICGNAFDHDRSTWYDVVACNYFLNCFREAEMVRMLEHAARLLKPDGHLLIADVSQPQGGVVARLFNRAYLKMGMISCWLMGMIPLHSNYDYTRYFARSGLRLADRQLFRWARFGPVLFQNLVAQRVA